MSHKGLPEGVARFLEREAVGGKILNHPNNGGYLRWRLSPDYKIWIDMEAFFKDEDFHLARHAFYDTKLLARVVKEYQPDFISAPIHANGFAERISILSDYVMVFFDDVEVLYVNQRRYPEMAEKHRLVGMDPFQMVQVSTQEALESIEREGLEEALERLLEIYPGGGMVRHIAAVQQQMQGAHEKALEHLEILAQNYPEAPQTYLIRGDVLRALGRYAAARDAYRQAAKRLVPNGRGEAYRKIGTCYLDEGRYAQAYRFLSRETDVFSEDTSLEAIYELATAARLAEKVQVARAALIYMGRYRLGLDDAVWMERIREDLTELGFDPSEIEGPDGA